MDKWIDERMDGWMGDGWKEKKVSQMNTTIKMEKTANGARCWIYESRGQRKSLN